MPNTFDWPSIGKVRPIWTGREFLLDGRQYPVLDYEAGDSGWSDDLTLFHEDVAAEGLHPIDVASRRHARAALKRYLRVDSDRAAILDVGCSSGFLLRDLAEDWPKSLIIGSDYIVGPLQRLATRFPTVPLLRFDLVNCPLPSESLNAIVLLNVLEHIEDDGAAVRQVTRILRRGGIAVVEVPAGPHLYDAYDTYLKHFRRYRLGRLVRMLEGAGLRVLERSHLGFFVYPAFARQKRSNQRTGAASENDHRAIVEQNINSSATAPLLKWAMAIEQQIGRWVRYPVGIRCVVTAMKP